MTTFPSRLCAVLAIALITTVSAARAGDVAYVYDDLGRLKAVIAPTVTNEAGIYTYL